MYYDWIQVGPKWLYSKWVGCSSDLPFEADKFDSSDGTLYVSFTPGGQIRIGPANGRSSRTGDVIMIFVVIIFNNEFNGGQGITPLYGSQTGLTTLYELVGTMGRSYIGIDEVQRTGFTVLAAVNTSGDYVAGLTVDCATYMSWGVDLFDIEVFVTSTPYDVLGLVAN